jgi:hypothetical protein
LRQFAGQYRNKNDVINTEYNFQRTQRQQRYPDTWIRKPAHLKFLSPSSFDSRSDPYRNPVKFAILLGGALALPLREIGSGGGKPFNPNRYNIDGLQVFREIKPVSDLTQLIALRNRAEAACASGEASAAKSERLSAIGPRVICLNPLKSMGATLPPILGTSRLSTTLGIIFADIKNFNTRLTLETQSG